MVFSYDNSIIMDNSRSPVTSPFQPLTMFAVYSSNYSLILLLTALVSSSILALNFFLLLFLCTVTCNFYKRVHDLLSCTCIYARIPTINILTSAAVTSAKITYAVLSLVTPTHPHFTHGRKRCFIAVAAG